MEETTPTGTTTEAAAVNTPARPQFITILCVLSFIGSGIWALVSLIGTFASGFIMSFLGIGANSLPPMEESGMSQEQINAVTEAASSSGGMASVIFSYFMVIMIVSLVLSIVSILGVVKMWKLKKSGYWLYTGVNGLLAILMLVGGSWFQALVGIAFIVMYGLNLKHMK